MRKTSNVERQADEIFRELMRHLRLVRQRDTKLKSSDIRQRLGVSDNFMSAFENGRKMPSLKLFLEYLLVVGFDIDVLMRLPVAANSAPLEAAAGTKLRQQIYKTIDSLSDAQIRFLISVAALAEEYIPTNNKRALVK